LEPAVPQPLSKMQIMMSPYGGSETIHQYLFFLRVWPLMLEARSVIASQNTMRDQSLSSDNTLAVRLVTLGVKMNTQPETSKQASRRVTLPPARSVSPFTKTTTKKTTANGARAQKQTITHPGDRCRRTLTLPSVTCCHELSIKKSHSEGKQRANTKNDSKRNRGPKSL